MATEFRLNYTGSEINRKLATVDEIKNNLENNYYASAEIDTKLEEVNASIEEVGSSIENKADLIDGKVPLEQLPDDIGGITEVDWEDIKDKPFGGEEGWSIEWDGTPTDEFVEIEGIPCLYKVSDNFIKKDDVVGATFKMSINGVCQELVLGEGQGQLSDYNEHCYGFIVYLLVTSQATTVDIGDLKGLTLPSSGIWFYNNESDSMFAAYLGKGGTIKTLDEKYIPDTIARLDENGKIPASQLPDDIGGVASWNDLEDKPFGESGWSIEWDGTPTDESFEPNEIMVYYKVSDLSPAKEEIIGAFVGADGVDMTPTRVEILENMIMDLSEYCYLVIVGESPLVFVTSQATEVDIEGTSFSFSSAGVWFLNYTDYMYTSYLGNGGIKKLDEKYIPDTIARLDENGKIPTSQLPDDIGGGVTSWNDLEDKPFGETGWSIEWDGTPTDEFVDIGGSMFYKVSGNFIEKSDLAGATMRVFADGQNQEVTIEERHLANFNEYSYGMDGALFFVTSQATEFNVNGYTLSLPSAGVWFLNMGEGSYVNYLGKGGIKTLDEKYIPDTIARKSDIPEIPEIDLSGKADLVNGKIPASQLPDDIVEPTAITISSPNGTRFEITVNDNGELTASQISG